MQSKRIVSICKKKHEIAEPVVLLNYTNFPFKMMIQSIGSLADEFTDEELHQYRRSFEEFHMAIIVRYPTIPTGRFSRLMSSIVVLMKSF